MLLRAGGQQRTKGKRSVFKNHAAPFHALFRAAPFVRITVTPASFLAQVGLLHQGRRLFMLHCCVR